MEFNFLGFNFSLKRQHIAKLSMNHIDYLNERNIDYISSKPIDFYQEKSNDLIINTSSKNIKAMKLNLNLLTLVLIQIFGQIANHMM